MSYYKYMVSVYRSQLPLHNSTMRSSSVERSYSSYGSSSSAASRFNRSSSAPPVGYDSDASYFGVMPFNRSLRAIEDRINLRRATSTAPSYSRSYCSYTPYGASTCFDYKVIDYANALDNEETTRSYINNLRSDYSSRSSFTSSFDNPYSTFGSSRGRALGYDSSAAYEDRLRQRCNDLSSYRVNSRDLYSYKHFRKSNQTLEDRNTRAKSPILSRELDRYYKTERRSSYLGDISSGGQRDFRYYNYRHVPYYGGSDHYAYVNRVARVWNNEQYPMCVPTYPVTIHSAVY